MDAQRRSDRARWQEGLDFPGLEEERRRQARANRTRAALATELRVHDAAVLDALLALGLEREKLPAIEWIPLVLLAWRDGAVQPAERAAILRAAERDGVPENHPAHQLLADWLTDSPRERLRGAWAALEAVAKCEACETDGDSLGFGRVSREGGVRIDERAHAFASERSR